MSRCRPRRSLTSTSPRWQERQGVIVVSATDGRELTTADQQKVASLASSLTDDKIPSVESVTTSALYLSANKKVQLVEVVFAGHVGDKGPNAAVPALRDRTDALLAGSGLKGGLTGNAAIGVDSTTAFDKAELVIAIATVLLILVLLGLVFRSVVIALFPIVVIGIVHQVAQAITADLADWFHFVVGPELAPPPGRGDVRRRDRLHRLLVVPTSGADRRR